MGGRDWQKSILTSALLAGSTNRETGTGDDDDDPGDQKTAGI